MGYRGSQIFLFLGLCQGDSLHVVLVAGVPLPSVHNFELVFTEVQESLVAPLLNLVEVSLKHLFFVKVPYTPVDLSIISKQFPSGLYVPKNVIQKDEEQGWSTDTHLWHTTPNPSPSQN